MRFSMENMSCYLNSSLFTFEGHQVPCGTVGHLSWSDQGALILPPFSIFHIWALFLAVATIFFTQIYITLKLMILIFLGKHTSRD